MSGMLASVTTDAEALLALRHGADIIDCKDPSRGALGALDTQRIEAIVHGVARRAPVSATAGDLPARPSLLREAVRGIAGCGVDYVKLGLFDPGQAAHCIRALSTLAGQQRLIAVFFADRFDPGELLPLLSGQGFSGVMIDTAEKRGPGLSGLWTPPRIARFVRQAKDLGLLCGLAGRLDIGDIPVLAPLGADYLGFRGALCRNGRTTGLDPLAVARVREVLDRSIRPPNSDNRSAGTVHGLAP